MNINFVTAYTPDLQRYRTDAFYLRKDCARLGLELTEIKYEDHGCWGANCRAKAAIFSEWLHEHRKPVVFLDADSRIFQMPGLFGEIRDAFGAVPTRNLDPRGRPFFASPLYFTEDAIPLVEAWRDLCEQNQARRPTGDHEYLCRAHEALPIPWYPLPAVYGGTSILRDSVMVAGLSHSKRKATFMASIRVFKESQG